MSQGMKCGPMQQQLCCLFLTKKQIFITFESCDKTCFKIEKKLVTISSVDGKNQ